MRGQDRGSATAELAVACPALVFLLMASLTGIGAVLTKLRCADAAREVALAVARGEPSGAAANRSAPDGAVIDLNVEGDLVRVVVRVRSRVFGIGSPGLSVEGQAVAAMEPAR